jgi:hypothetical protein
MGSGADSVANHAVSTPGCLPFQTSILDLLLRDHDFVDGSTLVSESVLEAVVQAETSERKRLIMQIIGEPNNDASELRSHVEHVLRLRGFQQEWLKLNVRSFSRTLELHDQIVGPGVPSKAPTLWERLEDDSRPGVD